MKKTCLLLSLLVLAGCASNDYALYADTAAKTEIARHNADAARYKAMSDIASSGTEAAKVAAVIAMALGQGTSTQASRLQAPQASEALQWAQVLVPGLTQIAGIAANARVAQVQSNNAARVAESTNNTFAGIAGKIQAPAANVMTTDSHAQTLTGTGTLGSGAYETTDSHQTFATPAVVTPTVVTPVVQVVPTVITPVIPIVPIVVTAPLVSKTAASGN